MPVEPRKIGLGIFAGTTFDLNNGDNTGSFIGIPVTFQLSEALRVNVNGGWLYDNVNDLHYATWGGGLEYKIAEPLTFIAEIFGQSGREPDGTSTPLTRPRAQVGLRWTPQERFDIDVIWGHNITGENSNWLTAGVNLRF